MSLEIVRVNPEAVHEDPRVMERIREDAGAIAREANRTSAEIGITYRDLPDGTGVRIGPRGAPAIAREVGTRKVPAARPVKKALDRRRLRG